MTHMSLWFIIIIIIALVSTAMNLRVPKMRGIYYYYYYCYCYYYCTCEYGDEPSGSKNAGNFLISCRTS